MALKVKAVERLVKFSKEDAGTYRYVMTPELYIALNQGGDNTQGGGDDSGGKPNQGGSEEP